MRAQQFVSTCVKARIDLVVRVQVQGTVEQPNAMLSEDVMAKGYALMCVSTPTSDCVVQEITEAEILDEQLCA